MDPSRARKITLQDAEALAMLGVDFVRARSEPVVARVRDDQAGGIHVGGPGLASERAKRHERLAEIRARYEADAPHQHFPTDHNCIVFGDGDPCARLMFVGEAPGADEDREGIPFVGKAGQLLNKMIAAMGLRREQVYIANVLKVRPPNNATPTPEQAALCAPYLYDQIRVVAPEAIVTLGLPASQLLLGRTDSMARMRSQWFEFPPSGADPRPPGFEVSIPVMPTYHPAYLLRQNTPENKRKVWQDLQLVMSRLGLPLPTRSG